MAKRNIKILGKLSDTNKQPIAKLRVEAWDKDMLIDDFVGEAISDEQGAFTISFTQIRYKELFADRNPDIYFKIYDGDAFIQSTENTVLWNIKAEEAIVEIVIDREKENPPVNKDQPFKVQGHVRNSDGSPFVGGLVYAYDKDLRTEVFLEKAITNDAGYYEIIYSLDKLGKTNKGNADLQVRVFKKVKDGEDKLLVESEIFFNAAPGQEINLTLTATTTTKEKSEWERVCEQVLPLLKGQKKNPTALNVFGDLLPEELNHDDFDFITKETGLDKNDIQLWSLAYSRNKEVSSIAAEVFYGWFRMGLPTELKDLWARTNDELQQKLKEAIDKNIIPVISSGMEKIIAAITQARQDFHLQPAKDGEKPSLGDVLKTAGNDWLDDEKKKKYVDIAKELDPDADEDFNKKMKPLGFTAAEKNILQQTLRLDKLTLSHLPLMEALHTYVKNDTDASLKPLATIHTDQWIDLAYTHGVPAGSTLGPEDYAIQLANVVEDRLPTASLASKVSNGEILFNQPGIEKIAPLLKTATDFDIVKDDIAAIAVKHKLDDESKGLLKKLQNLKKLGSRWEDTDAFINQGITSVQQIVEYSPEQLKAIFKDDVEPEKIATVQANAIAAQNIGIGLMGYLQPALYGVKAYVMESSNGQEQGRSTGSSAQPLMAASGRGSELDPTLRTLFGSLEQCACDPCLSVLSPAAYYADLLNYIDNSGNAASVLKRIRPDLYDLELSCDNSQIELPYIDLSLEILENKVAFPRKIKLPAGVKVFDELKENGIVGVNIHDALQNTAEEKLGDIIAGHSDVNPLQALQLNIWLLKDSYRRWLLMAKGETLTNYNPLIEQQSIVKYHFDTSKLNIEALLNWLNSDNPDDTNIKEEKLKFAIEEELLKKVSFKKVPKKFTTLVYTAVKAEDFHWTIKYEIKYDVVIKQNDSDPGKSDIAVINDKGEIEVIITINPKTAADTEAKLAAGKVPLLLSTDGKPKKSTVQPNNNKTGYTISYDYFTDIYYSPALLFINSLTYQSTKANTNLFAQPQNRNPLAYKILAGYEDELPNADSTSIVYPWSLPYNQPLTETRLLLEKAGTSRLGLLDAVNADENKFSNAEWARGVLGISAAQQIAMITSTSGDALLAVWGFHKLLGGFFIIDSFDQEILTNKKGLERASVVMQQAIIDYTELQGLLESKFINPGKRISIGYDQNCDPTKMLLQNVNDDTFFDRLHRFIRLWRVLGWSITELDQAIMSVKIGGGKLDDDDTLLHIAQIKILQQQSGIPLDTLIAFFNPFSDDKIISYTKSGKLIETASLYDRIFQNRLVQNPVNKDLAFDEINKEYPPTVPIPDSKKWVSLLEPVCAALGILQPELESFLQSGIVDFTLIKFNGKVTIDNLQSVWRNLSLARVMQLPLEEYAAAYRLIYPVTTPPSSSVSPFDNPLKLLKFIDEIKFIKQTGIKATELEKILSGRNEEDILPFETAASILTGLQKELRTITNLNFGKFKLEKTQLTQPPFIIPFTESERWIYWGLTEVAGSANWSVADPNDATTQIAGLPLVLLQQEAVLIQQINLLIPAEPLGSDDLITILQTSYVSPNGTDELKIVVTPGSTARIPKLTTVHLDGLTRFIYLKKVTDLSSSDLDNLIKSVASSGNEPLKYDLNTLIDAAQSIGLKQHDVIVNYFAQIYNQDIKSIDSVLSKSIKVHIRPADRLSPGLFIYSALQILISFDFWNENIVIEKTKLSGSDEYGFTVQSWKEGALIKEIKLEDSNEYIILIKLQKLFILNQYWKATPSQINWLSKSYSLRDTTFIGLMPDQLSSTAEKIQYLHWKRSTLLFQTAQTSAEFENLFTNYLAALTNTESATKVADSRNVLATAFGVKPEDVNAGATLQEMNTNAAGNFDPIKLCRLINYLAQLQKLGLNADQYQSLIAEPVNLSFESVRIARQVLFARYGAGNYADALKEVNNKLRMEARDRLVDYLVWKENVPDANGLYEKYLIDVEMSACMRTTRLLQSTAAAQLFVHRCLLNLQQEPKVSPDVFNRKRWEWAQNYRVWEANRKVFLYPENWLYPELRDDKTAAFRTFETALTQNEASDKNAMIALREYMDTLLDTSLIKVISMHVQSGSGETTLYQLGRSIGSPYNYFCRKCLHFTNMGMRWTGWEKIDADISGAHIVVFVHESDLHIAWAAITESEDDGTFQLQMSWIRQQTKGWISKKLNTESKVKLKGIQGRDTSKQIHLKTFYNNTCPEIYIYVAKGSNNLPSRVSPTLEEGIFGPNSDNVEKRTNPNFIPTQVGSTYGDGLCRISVFFRIYIKYQVNNIFYYNSIQVNDVSITLRKDAGTNRGHKNAVSLHSNQWYVDIPKEYDKEDNNNLKYQIEISFSHDGIDRQTFTDSVGISMINKFENQYRCNRIISSNASVPGYIDNNTKADMLLGAKLKFGVYGDVVLSTKESDKEDHQLGNDTLNFPAATNLLAESSSFSELGSDNTGVSNIIDTSDVGKFALIPTSGNDIGMNNSWAIRENQNSFIRFLNNTGSLDVLPSSYPEAGLFRKSLINDVSDFFEIEQKNINENNFVFGMNSLISYFKEGTILPDKDPRNIINPAYDLQFPNALYNWEVFYHLPIAAAFFLSKQHRFEEARKWFHYVFDPTTNDSSNYKERFWRFLPFRNNNKTDSVSKMLDTLSNPLGGDKKDIRDQITAWLADPFNPFAVARLRVNAYEWLTVTAYIKNLIEWGDQLFRRDTRESINEATLLYVMASDILGRRPTPIGSNNKSAEPLSYRALKGKYIADDGFTDAWVKLADTNFGKQMIADLQKNIPSSGEALNTYMNQMTNLAFKAGFIYFCVPPNEKLPELWDTVADRLFKIRNCKNFDGVTRNLPLLDPPIDPELLIRARAAGVTIADALSDMYAPPPLYRFNMVLQKATDLCNEVKALGGAMLSAIEKKEAEHLSLLRSGQEIEMQKLVAAVRQEQIKEAAANIEALKKSKENIIARIMYLQRQMGGTETTLDADGVPVLHESYISQPFANFDMTMEGLSSLGLTKSEVDQVIFMQTSNIFNWMGGISHSASSIAHIIEGTYPSALPPLDTPKKQAEATGKAFSAVGTFFNTLASHYSMLERRSGMIGGWQRRRDEWLYQAKTAVLEIKQIDKQIIASEIRKTIAEKELDNHYKQIEHTKTLDDYVRNQKFSSETLYTWMESRLSIVYKSAFDMAYEQAKKAEKAFRFELGDDTNFITPGYWDTMQRGLLAGEGLMQDLKRMEIAFMDRNKRDFEITKHISLAQLDPLALLQLRAAGTCNFDIPEVLFDMDFPGQYFRRIKSVSISMPCIAGPYTSISATLSLTANKLRRKATDAKLSTGYSSNQPSIATSHGQNDSGMFELNFRDERYLPFEGCGADSSWGLELPKEVKQFDYNTISDVVVHLKYTARFDSSLKTPASDSVKAFMRTITGLSEKGGLFTLINLKHDMPNEWNVLMKTNTTKISIDKNRLLYLAQFNSNIESLIFVAKAKTPIPPSALPEKIEINIIPGVLNIVPPPAIPYDPLCSLDQEESQNFYKGKKNKLDGKSDSISLATPFQFDLVLNPSEIDKLDELVIVVKYLLPQ